VSTLTVSVRINVDNLIETEEQGAGLTSGQTDARLNSKDVRQAVQGDLKTGA
jgi:hypothetical protein